MKAGRVFAHRGERRPVRARGFIAAFEAAEAVTPRRRVKRPAAKRRQQGARHEQRHAPAGFSRQGSDRRRKRGQRLGEHAALAAHAPLRKIDAARVHLHVEIALAGERLQKAFEAAVFPNGVVAVLTDGADVRFVGPKADVDALPSDEAELKTALRPVGAGALPVKTIDRADRDGVPDRRSFKRVALINGAHSLFSFR